MSGIQRVKAGAVVHDVVGAFGWLADFHDHSQVGFCIFQRDLTGGIWSPIFGGIRQFLAVLWHVLLVGGPQLRHGELGAQILGKLDTKSSC